ncbi:unnamed protein product [Camellia sinensis]
MACGNCTTWCLVEKLPPTDSRLRPEQRCLENGEYDMFGEVAARKMQESGWSYTVLGRTQLQKLAIEWKLRCFAKEKGKDTYRIISGYWEARQKGSWDFCPDIFCYFRSNQILDRIG